MLRVPCHVSLVPDYTPEPPHLPAFLVYLCGTADAQYGHRRRAGYPGVSDVMHVVAFVRDDADGALPHLPVDIKHKLMSHLEQCDRDSLGAVDREWHAAVKSLPDAARRHSKLSEVCKVVRSIFDAEDLHAARDLAHVARRKYEWMDDVSCAVDAPPGPPPPKHSDPTVVWRTPKARVVATIPIEEFFTEPFQRSAALPVKHVQVDVTLTLFHNGYEFIEKHVLWQVHLGHARSGTTTALRNYARGADAGEWSAKVHWKGTVQTDLPNPAITFGLDVIGTLCRASSLVHPPVTGLLSATGEHLVCEDIVRWCACV